MTRLSFPPVLLLCMTVAACSGAGRNSSSWTKVNVVPTTGMAQTSLTPGGAATSGTDSGKGIGPVDHVDIAPLDATRARAGEQLFQTKCSACHRIEQRYIGPALAGVTERRKPEWILNQILNPEVMIQKDPTAKALLAEYVAPMANQHLTREEAESILAYFLQHDRKAAEAQPAASGSSGEATEKAVKTSTQQ